MRLMIKIVISALAFSVTMAYIATGASELQLYMAAGLGWFFALLVNEMKDD